MNILAIDIGSYSIKHIEFQSDRRQLNMLDRGEIIIDEVKNLYAPELTLEQLQKEITSGLISKKSQDVKIVFQLANEVITTRYLNIPGNSKRKAEQIIPFQLDENLPYALSDAHYTHRLVKDGHEFKAICHITQEQYFRDLFSYFDQKELTPHLITSELAAIANYVEHINLNEDACFIDLGHKTTKAYFVHQRQIVSNHMSYTAGSLLNEVIAKTYNLSFEDAQIYKHENAFILTDDQMDEIGFEQKDFAQMMKQVFSPLLSEFKRWDVGFRIKHGKSIDKIYLIGGTSNINGIEQFFQYYTGIPVHQLEPSQSIKNDFDKLSKNFFMCKMMALSERLTSLNMNFLNGKYQVASSSFIPLHSAIFIWVRTTLLAACMLIFLIVEKNIFLLKEEKLIDQKFSNLFKKAQANDPDLKKSILNDFKNKPEQVLKNLKKKDKFYSDEVNSIMSSTKINALKPLAHLSRTLSKNPKVYLEYFRNENDQVNIIFRGEDLVSLQEIENQLKSAGFAEFKSTLISDSISLDIKFRDRE